VRPWPALGLALTGAALTASACVDNDETRDEVATTATTVPTTGTTSGTTTASTTDTGSTSGTTATGTASGTGTGTGTGTTEATTTDSSTTVRLDLPDPTGGSTGAPADGCVFVDILFVIDNSASMQTYQTALAASFPTFVDALWDNLPNGTNLHVGITTTDFDDVCTAQEGTSATCQTTADATTVRDHYTRPSDRNTGVRGGQGRLFNFGGQRFFAANTANDGDRQPLTDWFTGAATAAGEDGCSFEMPVAGAGWALDPFHAVVNPADENQGFNADFLRDEGALLVIFFLSDEPDKSPESVQLHIDQVLAAKEQCGGAECIVTSGLIEPCVTANNQKLWQFMKAFDDVDPLWGDIYETGRYAELVGATLATTVANACEEVPPVG
jgi:hypothetical protein